MFCAISGQLPVEPVVSRKSGHLFEKRLIERFIESDGKCPITHQELSLSDLILVQVPSIASPRPLKCASVPGLLETLANEWDDAMIESFHLRQELDLKRKELSQTLYQFDAACRTIGRLLKERDDERLPSNDHSSDSKAADNDNKRKKVRSEMTDIRLNDDLIRQLNDSSVRLSSARKSRAATVTNPSILSLSSKSVPINLNQPVSSMILSDNNIMACGLANGAIVIDNQTLHGHAASVFCLSFNSSGNTLVSASLDGLVNLWRIDIGGKFSLPSHDAQVTRVVHHPVDNLVLSSSLDSHWRVVDLNHSGGRVVNSVTTTEPILTSALHPDGLLFATSSASTSISIWDVKNSTIGGKCFVDSSIIRTIDFSENGYYMASGDDAGHAVIWDLRKLKPVFTYLAPSKINDIKFDKSGHYVTYCSGSSVGIGVVKSWDSRTMVENVHSDVISSVAFKRDEMAIATASMDGFVKFLT